jgi:lipopolysaccharide transport system permease protein
VIINKVKNFLRAIILERHIGNVWAYRGFVLGSVKREYQSKYRNSLLGAAWMVINPLSMILIYTVIFSQVMRARLPGVESAFSYSIYLCAGLLTWGMFAEISGRAQNIFLEHANLLKKLNFPRLCLPLIVVINAVLNFRIVFGIFSLFLLVSGNFPGWTFLGVFPLLLILVLFSTGLGFSLGVLNVFFRDVGQFYSVFVSFWFWLTPIIYPVDILPEYIRPWLVLNPMASLIASFQTILVMGQWPNWLALWPITLLSLFLCVFGYKLFRHHSGEMVDEI